MKIPSLLFGLVALAASAGPLWGQAVGARPTQAPKAPPSKDPRANPSGKATFVGTVRIADQFADPGTVVDVVIFRSGQTPISCAHATVGVKPAGPGETSAPGYEAQLEQTAICLNPDNVYHFYVNGVLAPETSHTTLPGTKFTYVFLNV